MLGDQRSILVGGVWVALFDRCGQPAVKLGTVGLGLRFIGDSADQWMAEGVLGAGREADLINELGPPDGTALGAQPWT